MLALNKAYNMDCMLGMKEFPDKYFDLACIDPPYGIGVQKMHYTTDQTRTGKALSYRKNYKHLEWDIAPEEEFFKELFRVSKHQIIWGGNYFAHILPQMKSYIIWDKRCSNNMANDFGDCELAWTDSGVPRVFRFLWNGLLQGNMKEKEVRFHPTQKPVALYRWLYEKYAKPGYKILDTHLGSGSSRIAAYDAGLDFIGFELDKEYFEKQEERFETYTNQVSLFHLAENEVEQICL